MTKQEKQDLQKLRKEVAQKRKEIDRKMLEINVELEEQMLEIKQWSCDLDEAFNDDELPEPTYANRVDYTPLRYY